VELSYIQIMVPLKRLAAGVFGWKIMGECPRSLDI